VSADVKAAVDAAFRDEWGRVVATLIRTTGDWDLAEKCAESTDWAQIALLYGRLREYLPSPVVELNHAVAVGMARGPADGLLLVEELEAGGKLTGYHLLPATRADFLRRLGRLPEAAVAYAAALELASTDADRRYLARRLAETSHSALDRRP